LTVGSDTRGHDGVEEGLLPQNRQDVRHVSEDQDHSTISVPIKNYKNMKHILKHLSIQTDEQKTNNF
jgi:hypothetical protein